MTLSVSRHVLRDFFFIKRSAIRVFSNLISYAHSRVAISKCLITFLMFHPVHYHCENCSLEGLLPAQLSILIGPIDDFEGHRDFEADFSIVHIFIP